MSLSSIHSTFNRLLKFLVDELAPDVIKMPQTKADKAANAKEFEEVNFRHQPYVTEFILKISFLIDFWLSKGIGMYRQDFYIGP